MGVFQSSTNNPEQFFSMIRFDTRWELDDLNVGGMRFTWSIISLGTVVRTAYRLGKPRMPGVIHNLD